MKEFIIEHWRDGELLERIGCSNIFAYLPAVKTGTMKISFRPGLIEIATEDELRFDIASLFEALNADTGTTKSEPEKTVQKMVGHPSRETSKQSKEDKIIRPTATTILHI
jgi:hypothetical protein